jgi:hypothetical protein
MDRREKRCASPCTERPRARRQAVAAARSVDGAAAAHARFLAGAAAAALAGGAQQARLAGGAVRALLALALRFAALQGGADAARPPSPHPAPPLPA